MMAEYNDLTTPPVMPPVPGPKPDLGLKKKLKIGGLSALGVLVALIVLGNIVGTDDKVADAIPTPKAAVTRPEVDADPTVKETLGPVSDVTGVVLKDARATLEDAGYVVVAHDSIESRSIIAEGNWVVTDQAVEGTVITLGVKKPDDPTAEEKAAADAAKAEADAATKAAADAAAAETAAYDALTLGKKNAIGQAKNYLDYSAFSRTGLIDQLEFEGFSTEEATFAVDYITPDWNAQAAAKAQQYLDYSTFSRSGLIDQLTFEGFSAAQAEFGATAVGY